MITLQTQRFGGFFVGKLIVEHRMKKVVDSQMIHAIMAHETMKQTHRKKGLLLDTEGERGVESVVDK